jgi:hypothetical protein
MNYFIEFNSNGFGSIFERVELFSVHIKGYQPIAYNDTGVDNDTDDDYTDAESL